LGRKRELEAIVGEVVIIAAIAVRFLDPATTMRVGTIVLDLRQVFDERYAIPAHPSPFDWLPSSNRPHKFLLSPKRV